MTCRAPDAMKPKVSQSRSAMTREEGRRASFRGGWGVVEGGMGSCDGRYGHGEGGWGVATALLLSLVANFEGK